ncbi:PilZ domain-containing protein [Albidovulum sediminicola]|uniref:PilZ domain-containing protein n=1 Tax=Albidovulum sediminicola TaxID=2984331 RepID=A0ABT2Z4I4_9RHOB|nr:PilZ domain-containing protein [Defluviimonas sp. WL0075]MCV2866053.1 PilZ domain-containing protein [Defluviimonas sp. WL0075]
MADDAIVHEAEVQRQYVRVRVPALVEIKGAEVECYDWSVNGLGLNATQGNFKVGQRISGEMGFNFDGFMMSVEFDAEVRHVREMTYEGRDVHRIGLEFSELSSRSQALLRYVSSAYITGEAVAAGDMLHLVQRDNSARPRKSAARLAEDLTRTQRFVQAMRQPISWIILAVVLTFSFMLTSNAFYRNAYIRTLATAEVTTDTPTARAPAAGVITFIAGNEGDVIPTGNPLLGVRRPSGEEIFVDSPCDCTIVSIAHTVREFVEVGDVVLRLLHPDSKTFVRLYVSKSNAPWLFENKPDYLIAQILGYEGQFSLVMGASIFDAAREMLVLELAPSEEIPSELAGRPATVIMDAGRSTIVGRIRSFFAG